jgi:hypothetical protein
MRITRPTPTTVASGNVTVIPPAMAKKASSVVIVAVSPVAMLNTGAAIPVSPV